MGFRVAVPFLPGQSISAAAGGEWSALGVRGRRRLERAGCGRHPAASSELRALRGEWSRRRGAGHSGGTREGACGAGRGGPLAPAGRV